MVSLFTCSIWQYCYGDVRPFLACVLWLSEDGGGGGERDQEKQSTSRDPPAKMAAAVTTSAAEGRG